MDDFALIFLLVIIALLCFIVTCPLVIYLLHRRSRERETASQQIAGLTRRVYALEQWREKAQAAKPQKTKTQEDEWDAEPFFDKKPEKADPSPPTLPKAFEPQESPLFKSPVRPERPAPAVPRPTAPPPQPPKSAVRIDWERWLGIRGAAVLGGVFLALGGILFFRYAVEHDIIPFEWRVILGIIAGIGCLIGSGRLWQRDYRTLGNAVAGAGVVILYASFWAAYRLALPQPMIPLWLAFVLMVLVTAAGCLVALQRHSQLTAILGLIGGFATPLLLSSGSDNPIGLFGYVLLLDLGLLAIGLRRRWPSLAMLALIGTVVMQTLWVGARMEAADLTLGLIILGMFAIVFMAAGRYASTSEKGSWSTTQAVGALLPFAFAIYFAARADFGDHLYPFALFLLVLSFGASWLSRMQGSPALSLGAATGSTAVIAVWLLARPQTSLLAWESVVVCFAIGLLFQLFAERDRKRGEAGGYSLAAVLVPIGFFPFLIIASLRALEAPLWPWLAGWIALAALLMRHATFPNWSVLRIVAAVALSAALSAAHLAHWNDPSFPSAPVFFGVLVAVGLLLQAPALLPGGPIGRRDANRAAATYALVCLVLLSVSGILTPLEPVLLLGSALLIGALAVMAATRLGSGAWFLAAAAATVLVHGSWIERHEALFRHEPAAALSAFVLQLGAVVFFTAWPFLARSRFRSELWAWRGAALAAPAWFFFLRTLFEARFGDAFIGVLPLALALLAFAAAVRVLRDRAETDPLRKSRLVWFSAVALGFVSAAIPLQLEKEWITIGWALEALAVTALWRHLDHPGLKYFGLALLAGAALRLVPTDAFLAGYARPEMRIFNWLLYTYLVPAAAFLCMAAILRPREIARARPWESTIYARGYSWGTLLAGITGAVVVFFWINLAIEDWFATGKSLSISFERLPARDLARSIAWAAYALVLLGIGAARKSVGLRFLSLAFFTLTIGKVFLYDLGKLEDLYLVLSLVGLAVSLFFVSFLYLRFVFRKASTEEK